MSPPNGVVNTTTNPDLCQNLKNEDDILKSSQESDTDNDEVIIPPDGGWGWMVVFGSFMCNMVVDGVVFSFGNFIKPISEEFSQSEAHVTLVGSLMSGFYLIVGPFASALANRYGFRLVAISGSILAGIAIALSYFANAVQYLCLTFGVIGGIGFGFIYVPAVITVGFYFERWRALATGIGVCGSGIGTFIFAPLTAYLIREFGWRIALVCLAGIVASCALFGILFRPLKPIRVANEVADEDNDPKKIPLMSQLKLDHDEEMLNGIKKPSVPSLVNCDKLSEKIGDNEYQIGNGGDVGKGVSNKRLSVPILANPPEGRQPLLDTRHSSIVVQRRGRRASGIESDLSRPMYRDDIFFSASLTRLPQYTSRTSIAYNISITKQPSKIELAEEQHFCHLCPVAVKRALTTMLDLNLLRSPSFLLLAFGGFLTMMGFYVPFIFLSDRATQGGLDTESAVFLISAIGIANTVGRVLCGLLSLFPGVDALLVTNVALTIGGFATAFSGFSMEASFQFTYTAVFGLAIACFASLRSIIVVDLLGLENLTNAFGLLLLFQGVAATIGGPLAAAFKVATGSYNASFYLSGGLLVASAVICYPLNYVNKWELRRKEEKNKKIALLV